MGSLNIYKITSAGVMLTKHKTAEINNKMLRKWHKTDITIMYSVQQLRKQFDIKNKTLKVYQNKSTH
jgi:hypothetical protein